MTIEQAYRKIRAYFSKPGAKFGYEEEMGKCYYRTLDHRKCAVGCLIPDEKYDQSFEETDLVTLLYDGLGFLRPDVEVGRFVEFLHATQRTHDSRALGKTRVPLGEPIWSDNTSGDWREIESSIPEFLNDLDALAKTHGVAV